MGSGEEEERKERLRKTGERSEENTLVKHTQHKTSGGEEERGETNRGEE